MKAGCFFGKISELCENNPKSIIVINKKMEKEITFIDLFAGIGGFHLAFHKTGKCVFVNEFDRYAQKSYKNYFGKINKDLFSDPKKEAYFWQDIREITRSLTNEPEIVWIKHIRKIIPKFHILCAGFPCQPFSLAGKKKGFDDIRGMLFNDIERIIKARKPEVIFLENVRNIVKHNNGETFKIIIKKLNDLGYLVEEEKGKNWDILRASDFGLPTNRNRLYLVAFKKGTRGSRNFKFPLPTVIEKTTLKKFFNDDRWPDKVGHTIRVGGKGCPIYKRPDGSWFIDRRNWDTYIIDDKKHTLSPEEGLCMMGFPENFFSDLDLSYGQKMRQLGNSVAVNVIEAIIKEILLVFKKNNGQDLKKTTQLFNGESTC